MHLATLSSPFYLTTPNMSAQFISEKIAPLKIIILVLRRGPYVSSKDSEATHQLHEETVERWKIDMHKLSDLATFDINLKKYDFTSIHDTSQK